MLSFFCHHPCPIWILPQLVLVLTLPLLHSFYMIFVYILSLCYTSPGQFEVLRTGPNLSAIKLRNVGQPQYYLAIIGGYLVGYVSGWFVWNTEYVIFMSVNVITHECMYDHIHVPPPPTHTHRVKVDLTAISIQLLPSTIM